MALHITHCRIGRLKIIWGILKHVEKSGLRDKIMQNKPMPISTIRVPGTDMKVLSCLVYVEYLLSHLLECVQRHWFDPTTLEKTSDVLQNYPIRWMKLADLWMYISRIMLKTIHLKKLFLISTTIHESKTGRSDKKLCDLGTWKEYNIDRTRFRKATVNKLLQMKLGDTNYILYYTFVRSQSIRHRRVQ